MRLMHRMLAGSAAGIVLIGGYTGLDIFDVVPGVLTTADAPREPVPAPGETEPPTDVRRPLAPKAPAARSESSGAMPDPATVKATLDRLLSAKSLGKNTSMLVRDAATGTVIYDRASDAKRTPASTTKVVSAYAVAKTLDVDQPLTTKAVATSGGELALVAGGDTMLGAGKGNPDAVHGHAGLGDLAAQVATRLKQSGRTSVRVGWDLRYAPGPRKASTWDQELIDLGFATNISMLGLDRDGPKTGTRSPADPAKNAAAAFVKALAAEGISASLGKQVSAPDGAAELGAIQSAPLGAVLGEAMRGSGNALTESLTRQAAASDGVPGDTESVTRWLLKVLKRNGFDLRDVTLKDTSGLADGTTIPARVLNDVVMRGATGGDKDFQVVLAGFPVAGWNGTLDDRFFYSDSRDGLGVVRAKTGSLPGTNSLAGTVKTKDGRILVFSLINNGKSPLGSLQIRGDLDRAVAALARCGC